MSRLGCAVATAAVVCGSGLKCSPGAEYLELSWEADQHADHYEVQIGVPESHLPIGGEYSLASSLELRDLMPDTRYWFRVRHHQQGHAFDSGWTGFSDKIECTTAQVPGTNRSQASLKAHAEDTKLRLRDSPNDDNSVDTWNEVEMIRHAHGQYEDGLGEHNAANALGAQDWLAGHVLPGYCVLTLYKVHIKKVAELPAEDHITAPGDTLGFANYMSCDAHGGWRSTCGTSGQPKCVYKCHPIHEQDCSWLGMSAAQCQTAQTHTHSHHAGLGVSRAKGTRLYTTPKAAEGNNSSWYRDKKYKSVRCHAGMTAPEMQAAFGKVPLRDWHHNVSAFEGIQRDLIV